MDYNVLTSLFLETQQLSEKVRATLIEFAIKHDLWNDELFSGITYAEKIDSLYELRHTYLTDELLSDLKAYNIPVKEIDALAAKLDKEYLSLREIETVFNKHPVLAQSFTYPVASKSSKQYNLYTKYGRRKAREQAWHNYQNYTPEEKEQYHTIETGFWIVFIIAMSLVGGCIYAVSGPEALIRWLK